MIKGAIKHLLSTSSNPFPQYLDFGQVCPAFFLAFTCSDQQRFHMCSGDIARRTQAFQSGLSGSPDGTGRPDITPRCKLTSMSLDLKTCALRQFSALHKAQKTEDMDNCGWPEVGRNFTMGWVGGWVGRGVLRAGTSLKAMLPPCGYQE